MCHTLIKFLAWCSTLLAPILSRYFNAQNCLHPFIYSFTRFLSLLPIFFAWLPIFFTCFCLPTQLCIIVTCVIRVGTSNTAAPLPPATMELDQNLRYQPVNTQKQFNPKIKEWSEFCKYVYPNEPYPKQLGAWKLLEVYYRFLFHMSSFLSSPSRPFFPLFSFFFFFPFITMVWVL
jgi:hypothetical protein